jgi:hypothetical protein
MIIKKIYVGNFKIFKNTFGIQMSKGFNIPGGDNDTESLHVYVFIKDEI